MGFDCLALAGQLLDFQIELLRRLPGQGAVLFLQAAPLFFEHLLRQLIDSFGTGGHFLPIWPQGFHNLPVQGALMPEPIDLLISGNLPVQAEFFLAHSRKICTKLGLLGSGALVGRFTGKLGEGLLRYLNLGFQFPSATDGIIAVGGQLGAGHGPGCPIQGSGGIGAKQSAAHTGGGGNIVSSFGETNEGVIPGFVGDAAQLPSGGGLYDIADTAYRLGDGLQNIPCPLPFFLLFLCQGRCSLGSGDTFLLPAQVVLRCRLRLSSLFLLFIRYGFR